MIRWNVDVNELTGFSDAQGGFDDPSFHQKLAGSALYRTRLRYLLWSQQAHELAIIGARVKISTERPPVRVLLETREQLRALTITKEASRRLVKHQIGAARPDEPYELCKEVRKHNNVMKHRACHNQIQTWITPRYRFEPTQEKPYALSPAQLQPTAVEHMG